MRHKPSTFAHGNLTDNCTQWVCGCCDGTVFQLMALATVYDFAWWTSYSFRRMPILHRQNTTTSVRLLLLLWVLSYFRLILLVHH